MALVIIDVKKPQAQRCNQSGRKPQAPAARVAQQAPSMPAQTTTQATQETERQKSYQTAFALIGLVAGVYFISQYNRK